MSDNPDYFVNNIIFELNYVIDTFPASLPTIEWLDGLVQYANVRPSSRQAEADLKLQNDYIFVLSIAMFIFNNLNYGNTRKKQVLNNRRIMSLGRSGPSDH